MPDISQARIVLFLLFVLFMLIPRVSAEAYAVQRPGQPYAESICNDAANGGQPGIILCEDFNFPSNFFCDIGAAGGGADNIFWTNPGLTTSGQAQSTNCAAADFPAASGFPAQPPGSPAGGNVFRMRPAISPAGSTLLGCILGDCDRTTADTPTTYQNGNSATTNLYFRLQMYNHTDWMWPINTDNKVLFFYPNRFTGRTDANVDAGLYFSTGPFCFNQNWSDALAFRVGSNAGNFKGYPADANIAPYNEHFEYCTGTGAPDGQFGDPTGTDMDQGSPPTQEPDPGTLFRLQRGRWYTIEFRYQLSTAGVENGIIEAWVDGVKVYGDNDLETCGGFGANEGSCYALHEIMLLGSWYNPFTSDYEDAQNIGSYRLIDNFIISTAPIGVPNEGAADTTAPAAPTNLRILEP